jgi:hypothetical protein
MFSTENGNDILFDTVLVSPTAFPLRHLCEIFPGLHFHDDVGAGMVDVERNEE